LIDDDLQQGMEVLRCRCGQGVMRAATVCLWDAVCTDEQIEAGEVGEYQR
jgi:hypothetical protein